MEKSTGFGKIQLEFKPLQREFEFNPSIAFVSGIGSVTVPTMEKAIDFFETSSIWKNKECLNHGYTPNDIKFIRHREKEIEELREHFKDAVHNIVPGNLFLYGKSGTGKTMITKFMTSLLEKAAAGVGIKIKTVYVHCGMSKTNTRVLRAINDTLQLDIEQKITPIEYSSDAYFSRFCQLMRKYEGILILVLDEMDKLQDPDIMNLFARVKESGLLEQNICILGITNDLKFEENLDSRTKSVLGRTSIIFTPYDANQLRDILYQRAEKAFNLGVLDEAVIPRCAAYAAQEHGDARKAIELLKLAGTIAAKEKSDKVTEEHAKKAHELVDQNLTTEVIRTLPTQSKLVLLSCVVDGLTGLLGHVSHTGDVYSIYKELSKMIGIETLTQRRMTDLLTELNTMSIITLKMVFKGRYGNTKEVRLTAPGQVYYNVIMEDTRIKDYEESIKGLTRASKLYTNPL